MALRHISWRKPLGAMAILVLLSLCALVIFSESIVRFLTESKGSEKIGRSLVIEGALDIDWHWKYTNVHVEDIRLGNAEGYKEPDMVHIAQLDFSFRPLKLLIGKLEFGDIFIREPLLVLERRSPDDANWNFPALSGASAVSETALADDRHNFPVFDQLDIRNGQVIYRDAVKGLNLDLKLHSVSGRDAGGDSSDSSPARSRAKGGFKIDGKGSVQGQRFTLRASGGSLHSLRDTETPFPLRIDLRMGYTQVLVDGKFQDPIRLSGIDTSLKLSGHNLADLFYLTAIPLPPTPPYRFEGRLLRKSGVWSYNDFEGVVGGSDLAGDLSYDTRGERGMLKAALVSRVLDSEDLGGFIGLSPSGEHAAPEQRAAAAKAEADPDLIPDVPLELERLRATDLEVTLNADRIEAPRLPLKGMKVRFDLKGGVLNIDPLAVTLADGTVDGAIHIDARNDVPVVGVKLNLRNLSLRQFFRNSRFEKHTEGRFGGRVQLDGAGLSLADVLASSNGKLAVILAEGKISLLLVEVSDLDLAQALPLFVGSDKPTPIRCGVADFRISDGILGSEVVVLDTGDSRLVGNIDIDLKHERINARLDAKPKDSSIFAAKTPIVVSGKLKSPSVGLEPKKTITQGASAVALGALVTPFAAIIPFIELGDAKDANCRALIEAAGK